MNQTVIELSYFCLKYLDMKTGEEYELYLLHTEKNYYLIKTNQYFSENNRKIYIYPLKEKELNSFIYFLEKQHILKYNLTIDSPEMMAGDCINLKCKYKTEKGYYVTVNHVWINFQEKKLQYIYKKINHLLNKPMIETDINQDDFSMIQSFCMSEKSTNSIHININKESYCFII